MSEVLSTCKLAIKENIGDLVNVYVYIENESSSFYAVAIILDKNFYFWKNHKQDLGTSQTVFQTVKLFAHGKNRIAIITTKDDKSGYVLSSYYSTLEEIENMMYKLTNESLEEIHQDFVNVETYVDI